VRPYRLWDTPNLPLNPNGGHKLFPAWYNKRKVKLHLAQIKEHMLLHTPSRHNA
jgi:hypothetical protein